MFNISGSLNSIMSVLCFVFYKELLNSLTYGIAAITLGIDKALLQMYKAVS